MNNNTVESMEQTARARFSKAQIEKAFEDKDSITFPYTLEVETSVAEYQAKYNDDILGGNDFTNYKKEAKAIAKEFKTWALAIFNDQLENLTLDGKEYAELDDKEKYDVFKEEIKGRNNISLKKLQTEHLLHELNEKDEAHELETGQAGSLVWCHHSLKMWGTKKAKVPHQYFIEVRKGETDYYIGFFKIDHNEEPKAIFEPYTSAIGSKRLQLNASDRLLSMAKNDKKAWLNIIENISLNKTTAEERMETKAKNEKEALDGVLNNILIGFAETLKEERNKIERLNAKLEEGYKIRMV